jgi:glutathione peroxidase
MFYFHHQQSGKFKHGCLIVVGRQKRLNFRVAQSVQSVKSGFLMEGTSMMLIRIYPNLLLPWVVWMSCVGMLGCGTGAKLDHSQLPPEASDTSKNSIYSFKLKDIDGFPIPLSRYEGKVLLVVNVASECRFTDQYANLQRLYMKYRDRGFVVLGFPSNDFGRQEPGSNAEIKEFTTHQFNIMFPLFSKISVKGERIHPLYQCLTNREMNGEFGGPITWNFNKFLIDRNGKTVGRFGSEIDPLDPRITQAIDAALE